MVGLGLGVIDRDALELLQRGDLDVGADQVGLDLVQSPRLDTGQGKRECEGDQEGAGHRSFTVTGVPPGVRRMTLAAGNGTPNGQRISDRRERAMRVTETALP